MKLKKKNLLFLMLLIMFSTLANAKNSPRNIQGELEYQIIRLEAVKSKIPMDKYNDLIYRYDVIVAGLNKTYSVMAQRIAKTLGLVPRRHIMKRYGDVKARVEYYTLLAESLSTDINQVIKDRNSRKIDIFASLSGTSMGNYDRTPFFKELWEVIYDELRRLSRNAKHLVKGHGCRQAAAFYEEVRWFTSEEIITKKVEPIEWIFVLGEYNAETLAAVKAKK